MNKCGTFSAATQSHVSVQARPLVSLAFPIDPAYSLCVQLFPSHSTEFPLNNFYLPISFLFLKFLRLQATCLLASALLDLLLSYRKKPYFIPYFLHSLSTFSFCGLSPYPSLNYNLVYCPFPLHPIFCFTIIAIIIIISAIIITIIISAIIIIIIIIIVYYCIIIITFVFLTIITILIINTIAFVLLVIF